MKENLSDQILTDPIQPCPFPTPKILFAPWPNSPLLANVCKQKLHSAACSNQLHHHPQTIKTDLFSHPIVLQFPSKDTSILHQNQSEKTANITCWFLMQFTASCHFSAGLKTPYEENPIQPKPSLNLFIPCNHPYSPKTTPDFFTNLVLYPNNIRIT